MMQVNGTLTRKIARLAAVLALAGALAVLLTQARVSDEAVGVTRTCGSALDSAIDRTGWDRWWASDLDEPDPVVRSALVRTRRCPEAVNRNLGIASALAVMGVGSVVLARAPRDAVRRRAARSPTGERVTRLGRIATWAGATLTVAGLIAVAVLVGDADSTLFLYTDRLVVAVVGLVVLTPTIALLVIGRVLAILGTHLDDDDDSDDDDSDDDDSHSDDSADHGGAR